MKLNTIQKQRKEFSEVWCGAKNKFCGFCFRERYALAAFALTYAALIVFAIIRKLAPFGQYSLLSIDLHGQYYPMMTEKLSDFFSVWSWHGGLGFSSVAQSAYYTNSLFLLLLAPFSEYARIAVLDLVIFLKLALAAGFFAYYLERRCRRTSLFVTAFGVAYGLSSYMTAFIAQPMWLDVVLLLPLILSGLECMMRGENPLRYTLLLALAIFSNFYISFALCLFLVLWFLVCLLSEKRRSVREILKVGGKFAGFSVLAGMLCAFTLLPLLANMENWISSSLSFSGELQWYHSASAIADAFSFGVKASREYGVANVFCGSASLFFLLAFLLNREIPLKKRLSHTALAILLFVSFEVNLLDFIWHGLHFPNQLPGRQSFLFIFILLACACETLTHRKGLGAARLFLSYIPAAAVLFMGLSESKNAIGRVVSALFLTLVLLLLTLSLITWNKKTFSTWCVSTLALVLLSETLVNGIFVACQYVGATDAVGYVTNEADMRELTKKYESGKHSFYRSEVSPNFTFNTGQLYGVKGITYYSSTMNGQNYRLFERLGNRVYAQNVSTIYQPTPMQDMMFGVKYYYMRSGRRLDYGSLVEKAETVSVYESPYALPVAYAADDALKRFMTVSVEEPDVYESIELQAKFVTLAAGLDATLIDEAITAEPLVRNGRIDGKYIRVTDTDSEVSYYAEFFAQKDGWFYLDFDFKVGNYTAYVNGSGKRSGACGSDPLTSMGYVKKGDWVSVEIKVKGYSTIMGGVNGWIVDDAALANAHETLAAGGLQIHSASNTKIKGMVYVQKDGVLYSSIPAENGWDVYIDGEKQKTYDLDAGLLCCDITAGTHIVEYRYHAPGLSLGIAVSLAAAIILASYIYYIKKKSLV